MTSIRDLASHLGLAPSTVSRYLNQSGYVAKETGLKIEVAIQELDYSPNRNAQNLSWGKTNRVGVVIPHTKHPYFLEIIKGLMEAAFDSDYQLLFLPSHYEEKKEKDYLEQLKAKSFDALIFTSRSLAIKDIEAYHKYGRIVLLEQCQSPYLSSISIDRQSGLLKLMAFIETHQIDRPLFLFTRNHQKSATYLATLEAFQKIFGHEKSLISIGGISSPDDAYEKGPSILAHKPSLVVANSDDVAVGLLRYYQDNLIDQPIILSQEAQVSGQLKQIPSLENHSYQLGVKAFKLALENESQHLNIKSQFLTKR